jgi:hypothetical protein
MPDNLFMGGGCTANQDWLRGGPRYVGPWIIGGCMETARVSAAARLAALTAGPSRYAAEYPKIRSMR